MDQAFYRIKKITDQFSMMPLGPINEVIHFDLCHRLGLRFKVGLVLWHINLCRLFNAKSIFIQINNSISNSCYSINLN